MSRLWTYGCSFTADYNLNDGIYEPYTSSYDEYRKFKGGILPDVWPEILGKKIGYDTYNCAVGGSSNYKILNQYYDTCHLIQKDDIVIFGWTSLERFRLANLNENMFIDILPMGFTDNNCGVSKTSIDEILVNRTHNIWTFEVMGWIQMINHFMDGVGAEVYHWTTDPRIFSRKTKNIDKRKFLLVNDAETNKENIHAYLALPKFHNDTLKARITEETDGLIYDDHYGEYGHKVQAQYFYEHIKENTKIEKIIK